MNKFKLGMKMAQLEAKVDALCVQNDEFIQEEESQLFMRSTGLIAVDPDSGKILTDAEQKAHKLYQKRLFVSYSGGLSQGKTGFPEFRNYNTFSGYVQLVDENSQPIRCNIIRTSSKDTCLFKHDDSNGRWKHYTDHDSRCFYGYAGRMYGAHKPHTMWCEFKPVTGGTYYTTLHWGC